MMINKYHNYKYKNKKPNKKRLNCYKIQQLGLPPVTLKPVLINHICVGAPNYLIDITQRHTNITYIGQPNIWTQLLARHLINPQKIIQYLFKITKSQTNSISLGIIDKKYQNIRSCNNNNNNSNSSNSGSNSNSIKNNKQKNCIFYYGGSGRLWEGGNKLQKQGHGFKQGNIVIMIVYLKQGAIRWYVNGKLQAQFNSYQFIQGKYRDVQWVPFVNMCNTNDKLIWQVGQ